MENIDILWFIEHVSRELDVAAAVRVLLEKRFKRKVVIVPYAYPDSNIKKYNPKIVLLPFCYTLQEPVLQKYVSSWPHSLFVNLAWEQIFYKANLEYKAPRDTFTQKFVWHHSWSRARSNFLQEKEVPKEHIFVNGQPAYMLYDLPYKNVFAQRTELGAQFNLNPKKTWIFFPENYSWFFYSEHNLREIIKGGQSKDTAYLMREYSGKCFKQVIEWLDGAVDKFSHIEIILRPRPATNIQYFKDVLNKFLPPLVNKIHIIKDYSVREWILASDIVISSFSTSLIEASIAKKPIFMLEPYETPLHLQASWYQYAQKIKIKEEFFKLCRNDYERNSYLKLHQWARKEFFVNNDPIMGLVDFLGNLKFENLPNQKEYIHQYFQKSNLRNTPKIIIDFLGKIKRRLTKDSLYYKNDDEDKYLRAIEKRTQVYQDFFKKINEKI